MSLLTQSGTLNPYQSMLYLRGNFDKLFDEYVQFENIERIKNTHNPPQLTHHTTNSLKMIQNNNSIDLYQMVLFNLLSFISYLTRTFSLKLLPRSVYLTTTVIPPHLRPAIDSLYLHIHMRELCHHYTLNIRHKNKSHILKSLPAANPPTFQHPYSLQTLFSSYSNPHGTIVPLPPYNVPFVPYLSALILYPHPRYHLLTHHYHNITNHTLNTTPAPGSSVHDILQTQCGSSGPQHNKTLHSNRFPHLSTPIPPSTCTHFSNSSSGGSPITNLLPRPIFEHYERHLIQNRKSLPHLWSQIRSTLVHFPNIPKKYSVPLHAIQNTQIDLTTSWFSVLWVPISPSSELNNELSGQFLTYHGFELMGPSPLIPPTFFGSMIQPNFNYLSQLSLFNSLTQQYNKTQKQLQWAQDVTVYCQNQYNAHVNPPVKGANTKSDKKAKVKKDIVEVPMENKPNQHEDVKISEAMHGDEDPNEIPKHEEKCTQKTEKSLNNSNNTHISLTDTTPPSQSSFESKPTQQPSQKTKKNPIPPAPIAVYPRLTLPPPIPTPQTLYNINPNNQSTKKQNQQHQQQVLANATNSALLTTYPLDQYPHPIYCPYHFDIDHVDANNNVNSQIIPTYQGHLCIQCSYQHMSQEEKYARLLQIIRANYGGLSTIPDDAQLFEELSDSIDLLDFDKVLNYLNSPYPKTVRTTVPPEELPPLVGNSGVTKFGLKLLRKDGVEKSTVSSSLLNQISPTLSKSLPVTLPVPNKSQSAVSLGSKQQVEPFSKFSPCFSTAPTLPHHYPADVDQPNLLFHPQDHFLSSIDLSSPCPEVSLANLDNYISQYKGLSDLVEKFDGYYGNKQGEHGEIVENGDEDDEINPEEWEKYQIGKTLQKNQNTIGNNSTQNSDPNSTSTLLSHPFIQSHVIRDLEAILTVPSFLPVLGYVALGVKPLLWYNSLSPPTHSPSPTPNTTIINRLDPSQLQAFLPRTSQLLWLSSKNYGLSGVSSTVSAIGATTLKCINNSSNTQQGGSGVDGGSTQSFTGSTGNFNHAVQINYSSLMVNHTISNALNVFENGDKGHGCGGENDWDGQFEMREQHLKKNTVSSPVNSDPLHSLTTETLNQLTMLLSNQTTSINNPNTSTYLPKLFQKVKFDNPLIPPTHPSPQIAAVTANNGAAEFTPDSTQTGKSSRVSQRFVVPSHIPTPQSIIPDSMPYNYTQPSLCSKLLTKNIHSLWEELCMIPDSHRNDPNYDDMNSCDNRCTQGGVEHEVGNNSNEKSSSQTIKNVQNQNGILFDATHYHMAVAPLLPHRDIQASLYSYQSNANPTVSSQETSHEKNPEKTDLEKTQTDTIPAANVIELPHIGTDDGNVPNNVIEMSLGSHAKSRTNVEGFSADNADGLTNVVNIPKTLGDGAVAVIDSAEANLHHGLAKDEQNESGKNITMKNDKFEKTEKYSFHEQTDSNENIQISPISFLIEHTTHSLQQTLNKISLQDFIDYISALPITQATFDPVRIISTPQNSRKKASTSAVSTQPLPPPTPSATTSTSTPGGTTIALPTTAGATEPTPISQPQPQSFVNNNLCPNPPPYWCPQLSPLTGFLQWEVPTSVPFYPLYQRHVNSSRQFKTEQSIKKLHSEHFFQQNYPQSDPRHSMNSPTNMNNSSTHFPAYKTNPFETAINSLGMPTRHPSEYQSSSYYHTPGLEVQLHQCLAQSYPHHHFPVGLGYSDILYNFDLHPWLHSTLTAHPHSQHPDFALALSGLRDVRQAGGNP
jgi:hypothetical protein